MSTTTTVLMVVMTVMVVMALMSLSTIVVALNAQLSRRVDRRPAPLD